MAKTHFPRAGGQQWADSFYHFGHLASGNIFFVHNGGTATGPGYSPETAYSTIDNAINACTADNGDLIIVLEDHAETIGAAAAIALDVAGVKILGLGEGRRRPRITFGTAAGASIDITAARCVLENMVFICGFDALTAMFNVQAADFVMKNCEVQTGDATNQATLGILTNASADRMRIEDCHFHGTVDAGTTSQISIVGGDSIVLKNSYFIAACGTTGNIAQATTLTANIIIDGCTILNQTADANNKCLVFGATSTGTVRRTDFHVIDSTSPTPWTAAGLYFGGNYWAGAADTAGTLR